MMKKKKEVRKKMSRYPFGDYASTYMDSVRGIYSDKTWKNRMRR